MRLYKNNSASRTTRGLPAVSGSGQSLFVANGAAFPRTRQGSNFFLTLDDEAGHYEIVLVTGSPGTAGPAVLVVDRAQQGTSARAWPVNSLAERRVTAQELREFWSEASAATTLPEDLTIGGNLSAGSAAFDEPLLAPFGGTSRESLTDTALLVGGGVRPVGFISPGANEIVASSGAEWDGVTEGDFIARAMTKQRIENALATPLSVAAGGTGNGSFGTGSYLLGVASNVMTPSPMGTLSLVARSLFKRKMFYSNTSGAGTFSFGGIDLPAGVDAYIFVTLKGAGGGGGRSKFSGKETFYQPGYNGGDGALVYGWYGPFRNSESISYSIGSGGAEALLDGDNGGDGEETSVSGLRLFGPAGDVPLDQSLSASGGKGAAFRGNIATYIPVFYRYAPRTAYGDIHRSFFSFAETGGTAIYQVTEIDADEVNGLVCPALSKNEVLSRKAMFSPKAIETGGGGRGGSGALPDTFSANSISQDAIAGEDGSILIEVYF